MTTTTDKGEKVRYSYNKGRWNVVDTAEYYLDKAREADQQNHIEKGLKLCSKAIELDPDYVEAYRYRGYLREKTKRYKDARLDFDKAIELAPNDYDLYFRRGAVLMDLEDYHPSLTDLSKSIELNPQFAESWYYRAQTKLQLGVPRAGLKDMNTAVELDPELAKRLPRKGSYIARHKCGFIWNRNKQLVEYKRCH